MTSTQHIFRRKQEARYGSSSKKLNTELPLDPAIPVIDIDPKRIENRYQVNIHAWIFIAA